MPRHKEVLEAWRDLILESRSLGLADRTVLHIQLQHRAEQLSVLEGLAEDAADLKGDTDAFVTSVKQSSPVTSALTFGSLLSGILGFFGLWSFAKIKEMAEPALQTAEQGAMLTGAAVTGFLAAASGGVLVYLARGAYAAIESASAALSEFSARDHPSAARLRRVQPVEAELFALFGRTVPSRPVSAGPLIALGLGCMIAGAIFAFLIGVGSA